MSKSPAALPQSALAQAAKIAAAAPAIPKGRKPGPARFYCLATRRGSEQYSGLLTYQAAKRRADRDVGAVFEYGRQGAVYIPAKTVRTLLVEA